MATVHGRALELLVLPRVDIGDQPVFWAILGSGWGGTIVGWPILTVW